MSSVIGVLVGVALLVGVLAVGGAVERALGHLHTQLLARALKQLPAEPAPATPTNGDPICRPHRSHRGRDRLGPGGCAAHRSRCASRPASSGRRAARCP